MTSIARSSLLALALLVAPAVARAGVYSDDLARCLVDSTSKEDRIALVQWMFAAASAHPAVKPMTSVSADEIDAANKRMADLIVRLLTESCADQARKAIQYEGNSTIETGFTVLGQVAGKELFQSPEVAGALSGVEKYLDGDKLKSLNPAQP